MEVVDYSILMGVDPQNGKLVMGIIDYVRAGVHRARAARHGGCVRARVCAEIC